MYTKQQHPTTFTHKPKKETPSARKTEPFELHIVCIGEPHALFISSALLCTACPTSFVFWPTCPAASAIRRFA